MLFVIKTVLFLSYFDSLSTPAHSRSFRDDLLSHIVSNVSFSISMTNHDYFLFKQSVIYMLNQKRGSTSFLNFCLLPNFLWRHRVIPAHWKPAAGLWGWTEWWTLCSPTSWYLCSHGLQTQKVFRVCVRNTSFHLTSIAASVLGRHLLLLLCWEIRYCSQQMNNKKN